MIGQSKCPEVEPNIAKHYKLLAREYFEVSGMFFSCSQAVGTCGRCNSVPRPSKKPVHMLPVVEVNGSLPINLDK